MKQEIFDIFWREQKADLVALIKQLIPTIQDDFGMCDDEPGTPPNMQITISIDETCENWTYQTGDNSYTGGCYHHPYWGVSYIYRDSKPETVANELLSDLSNQIEWS